MNIHLPASPSRMGTFSLALAAVSVVAHAQPLTVGEPISFELEVLPVLRGGCVECHQPDGEGYETSGLDLRDYEGLMRGTKYGPMVVPGDFVTSNLMVLLDGRSDPSIRMPFHRGRLRQAYINIIRHWIREGAMNN